MSSKKLRFRPTVQTLETRKLMAADAMVLDFVPVDIIGQFTAPAEQTSATIDGTTIVGNTANSEGGGLWNRDFDDVAATPEEPARNLGNYQLETRRSEGSIATVNDSDFLESGGRGNDILLAGDGNDGLDYPGFIGGVRVATGDINNDGTPNIVARAGIFPSENHDAIFSELASDPQDPRIVFFSLPDRDVFE